jgi:hypothetical protein
LLKAEPGLIDFVHNAQLLDQNGALTLQAQSPPFDDRDALPALAPATPRPRSALFLHNNYYHFNCLSRSLRQRGWDAVTVSIEPPDSAQQKFYHGEDINLHHPDPAVMNAGIRDFLRTVPERFGAIHFSHQGSATFFPENIENDPDPMKIPWDFFELRRHRIIIGYMPSGCLDGARQSSIRRISGNVCARCIWELRPEVCHDRRSAAWAERLDAVCDWIGLEGDWAVDERRGDKFVRRPVVTALDPEQWRPDIAVPNDMRIEREPGEILIYHAVGNYASRHAEGRDIKGTGAVIEAVERLQAEGAKVRLAFIHDVPSTRVRFIQVQADIVVDQLNYGRYGANARESLMLGKPVVGRIVPNQADPIPPLQNILEAPIVNADESTVYENLKVLVADPDLRIRLGQKGRSFALRWHGADICALRYERILDRVRAGLPAEADEVFS